MFLAIAQSVPVQSIINNLLIFDLEFLCAIVKLIGFLGWGFSGWNRAEVSSACVPPSSGWNRAVGEDVSLDGFLSVRSTKQRMHLPHGFPVGKNAPSRTHALC
jgi:hypothetical protein